MNRVKQYRQAAKLSQTALAERVGLKRQAIYDIESGRYLPNTGVAISLAGLLGCRVEDLFYPAPSQTPCPVVSGEDGPLADGRVCAVKIRGKTVVFPVDGDFSFSNQLRPADGVFERKTGRLKLFGTPAALDRTVLLTGCDPAFALLAAHASRADATLRVACRFASTHASINRLARGKTHIAGMHLHNPSGQQANAALARQTLSGTGAAVIGFSMMEEGFMVARGNPKGIRSAADLAKPGVSFVNRESGAALRALLDDCLAADRVPARAVSGYDAVVNGHTQGAQMVAFGRADAVLGLRPVARAFNLDFVPLAEVRCDLVVPSDMSDDPKIKVILDVLQDSAFRDELSLLPGYGASQAGKKIASF